MKKTVLVLALTLSLFSASALAPRPAQAWIGDATGNPLVFVIGAVLAIANGGVFVSCVPTYHGSYCRQGFYIHGGAGLLGLLLMDGEKAKSQDLAFAELNAADAVRLGVSESDREAYNHELGELNAARQTIGGEVLQRLQKHETVTQAEVHARWMTVKDQFSPEAFRALEKVSAQIQ